MSHTIKSFVIRAGRVSQRQQLALDTLLDKYCLQKADNPWCVQTIFGRTADTIVEIGFGMGESYITMAESRPDLNFIGIEVHRPGIGSALAMIHEKNLTNVRLVTFDAVEVFTHCLPLHTIIGVHIFFPDPWPKKRHNKRRLIQPEFVKLMLTKIKNGGYIHSATDWQEYAEHMHMVFANEPLLRPQNDGSGFVTRPITRPLTKFEKRGQRLGHGVWDLIYTVHLA